MFDALAQITRRVLSAVDRPARLPSSGRPSGIALVIALVTITVLSAAVVEYAYSTRVNLTMSVNAKDKVKSYFLARSGINLSRLLLNFQYSLQSEAKKARNKKNLQTGSCNPQMISIAMQRSNFQIYQYLDLLMRPFNSGKLETPVGGIHLSRSGVKGFGGIHGNFDVDIKPESGKLNLNRFAVRNVRQSDVQDFCALVLNSEYAKGYYEKQSEVNFANFGADEKPGPMQTLERIVDYIDLNETQLGLTRKCTLKKTGGGGSESAVYDDFDSDIEPRNAKLTHLAEIHKIPGIRDGFLRAFRDHLTVYPVGKPNANAAGFPVFYSVLCRNAQLQGKQGSGTVVPSGRGPNLCQSSKKVRAQVILFAVALDGLRAFFENPLNVLMWYVTAKRSSILPHAEKGQPVAFLRSGQVHGYLRDLKHKPKVMAWLMSFSPAYRQLRGLFQRLGITPQNPKFPEWVVRFDRSGIVRALTTESPSIYRIKATGTFGTTDATIETVVDFSQTIRRLPKSDDLKERTGDPKKLKKLKKALRKRREKVPKGRVLFWRENVTDPVEEGESGFNSTDSSIGAEQSTSAGGESKSPTSSEATGAPSGQ
ncbi:MAG: hypothetical protein ABEL76_16605 [Bradymonadaceae bacterium]